MLLELKNEDHFNELIQESHNKLVFIYFWAPWSNVSKKVMHTLNNLEKEIEKDAIFISIDIDEYKSIADKYDINNIPTIASFKDGEILKTFSGVGLTVKDRLTEFIKLNFK